MSEKQLTPWFPGTTKPSRVGVYERDFFDGCAFAYSLWDGHRWLTGMTSLSAASRAKEESAYQPHNGYPDFLWRGLANKP